MYYQLYNYQTEQVDNTRIYEKTSLEIIPVEHNNNYNGLINITNYKNEINIVFYISSHYKFDSIMISISFSVYKNLYQINTLNNYNLYVPANKEFEFYVYTNVSNFYKNIIYNIEYESQIISNYYYFYDTDNIDDIYLDIINNDKKYDGNYTSYLIDNNLHEIIIDKTKYKY